MKTQIHQLVSSGIKYRCTTLKHFQTLILYGGKYAGKIDGTLPKN